MALIIPGAARCSICGAILQKGEQIVCFRWIQTDDPELLAFSDAGVHYRCLESHPKRGMLEGIYLAQLGSDGVRPNGSHTMTLSDNMRVRLSRQDVVLCYAPLLLTLELPRPTATAWSEAEMWNDGGIGSFSGKGFGVAVEASADRATVIFRLMPYGYTPEEADPLRVRTIVREIPLPSLETLRVEFTRVLTAIRQPLEATT